MAALYDDIGIGYARFRRPEPSFQRAILEALDDAERVVNVGAGAGSYEPADRSVVAVEPSIEMIRQRPPDAAPVVQGDAVALPFAAGAFDAAMATFTVHHWPDRARGLEELKRVARRRIVVVTSDPAFPGFWLTDYIPQLRVTDRADLPTVEACERVLGRLDVVELPVPHDCADGFLRAYWRRPEAYLDPEVRAAISAFPAIGDVSAELQLLAHDLATGDWHRRYGDLLERDTLDLGYRLLVATL